MASGSVSGDMNKLVALATNSTDSNGTETTGIFHNNYGSPDDENTDTNAKVTLYGNAETFSYVNDLGYALINSVELQLEPMKPVSHLHLPRWQLPWPEQSPGQPIGVEHAFPANPMSQKQRPSQEGRGVKRDN